MISCQLVTNQFRGLDRTRVGQGMTGARISDHVDGWGTNNLYWTEGKRSSVAGGGFGLSLGSFASFNVTASAHSKLSRAPSSESAIA